MGEAVPDGPAPILSDFGMADSALYKIRVRGELNPDYSMCLEGMNITGDTAPDGTAESILVGRLTDQAALSGLLNSLYDMKLPLVSVRCLESE